FFPADAGQFLPAWAMIFFKGFFRRACYTHTGKECMAFQDLSSPAAAGKQPEKGCLLHICMIVEYQKGKRLLDFLQPEFCKVMIIAGIQKMDSLKRQTVN